MLTQTNPLHLTITSLLIYCKGLNRCYEPSVVLFFHDHKDKKIMWVPNIHQQDSHQGGKQRNKQRNEKRPQHQQHQRYVASNPKHQKA